jgi:hypothetical protein
LLDSVNNFFQIDPVLLVLGMAGFVFAVIKRDFLLLLWIIPFVIFLVFIGFVQYFYLISVIPVFCIAAAKFVAEITTSILKKKKKMEKILTFAIISAIGIFGLISTTILITTGVNFSYFRIYAFIVQHLMDLKSSDNKNNKITVIGDHWWVWNSFWIPKLVLDKEDNFIPASDRISHHFLKDPITTEKILFLSDNYFINTTISHNPFVTILSPNNTLNVEPINMLYKHSKTIATFTDNVIPSGHDKYPYNSITSMIINEKRPLGRIEIKTNY